MKLNKIVMAAVGVALVGVGVNANAGVATGSLTPSLTITGNCLIGVTNAAFPNSPVSAGAVVVAGTIGTVTITGCAGANYWLGANGGANYGVTNAALRNLSSGTAANNISYTMALNGAGIQPNWGTVGMPTAIVPAAAGTNAFNKLGATASDVYNVTGSATITAAAIAAGAATYTDTVTVTVEF